MKAFLTWQTAVTTLHRWRKECSLDCLHQEERAALQDGAGRKVGQGDLLQLCAHWQIGNVLTLQMGSAIEEVTEWEQRVEESQDCFHKISEVIKVTWRML